MGVGFNRRTAVAGIATIVAAGVFVPVVSSATYDEVVTTPVETTTTIAPVQLPKPVIERFDSSSLAGKAKAKKRKKRRAAVETVETTTTVAAPTTTEPPAQASFNTDNYHCPQWFDAAMAVGFTPDQWPKLSHIIHRESRCDPMAWNRADPGTGSRGLTQINSFWCSINKNNPSGFLQAAGVLSSCDDLFNPSVSLKATYVIWNRSGWSPWGG